MEDPKHLEMVEHLKHHLGVSDELERMVALFKALGDVNRVRIILALSQTTLSVTELTEVLDLSQSSISHQLSILKQRNLVKGTRSGKNIHYSLADQHIMSVVGLVKEHVAENEKKND
ncbi:ArsR/SmtB family transcription factor [Secundilactobacillus similis]|nr:metalloregulator ArsR/SmtB family transcription factor [Secundilactobacillus similis]